MQVRVFQSIDMASGLKMIKQELGPDALILSTKTVRNGKLGLLGKPLLEITAAIDTDFPRETTSNSTEEQFTQKPHSRRPKKTDQVNRSFNHIINDPVEQFLGDEQPRPSVLANECFREYPTSRPEKSIHSSAINESPKPDDKPRAFQDNTGLESEVSELKQLVKDLAGQITVLHQKEPASLPENSTEPHQGEIHITPDQFTKKMTVNQIQGDHLLTLLLSKGVNIETARTISGFIRESLTELELSDTSLINRAIIDTLQNLIEVNPPAFSKNSNQRRIALVGPTGVGKTTTLAKIAASYLQRHSNSIALITIDTYRIAAVEQLKVYGEIMHLPVDVVITPDQLGQALDKHQDKELILIDTAGRSPRDSFCIDELSSFLSAEHNIEKHLVLSATTRENEIVETINQFSKLIIANTIFTKIDECMSLGVLLNTQLQNSNPISYITNGQRVPEDLLEITPQKIAELIMSQDQGSMHE